MHRPNNDRTVPERNIIFSLSTILLVVLSFKTELEPVASGGMTKNHHTLALAAVAGTKERGQLAQTVRTLNDFLHISAV